MTIRPVENIDIQNQRNNDEHNHAHVQNNRRVNRQNAINNVRFFRREIAEAQPQVQRPVRRNLLNEFNNAQ